MHLTHPKQSRSNMPSMFGQGKKYWIILIGIIAVHVGGMVEYRLEVLSQENSARFVQYAMVLGKSKFSIQNQTQLGHMTIDG